MKYGLPFSHNRKTLAAHVWANHFCEGHEPRQQRTCKKSLQVRKAGKYRKCLKAMMTEQLEIPFFTDEPLPAAPAYGVADMFPLDNLIPEIIDPQNMSDSFDYVVSHLEYKHQREKHRPWKEKYIADLTERIGNGTFRLDPATVRTIHVTDGPKERDVQCPRVPDRIGVHAVMTVVERYTYPALIHNTAASIKGRGMHWLHHIIEDDIDADHENMSHYYQSDIEHYYDNINQLIMMAQTREYISDPVLLPITDGFITLMPEGLSKGLRSSQTLANLHLNGVDHAMCDVVSYHEIPDESQESGIGVAINGDGHIIVDGKIRRFHYYRYCDDIVFFAADKKTLWMLRDKLVWLLAELGLKIKNTEPVRPITEGLDYLGYVTYGLKKPNIYKGRMKWSYTRIRKRTKVKAARRLHKVRSRKRRQEIIGSFKGMLCHADGERLFNKLTNQRMAKFSELGLPSYTPKDGKKRFNCSTMQLGQIANRPIEILDVESEVQTKYGLRHLVKFHFIGEVTEYKFFTDSDEMKFQLNQMKERDLLPVETTIVLVPGTGAIRCYQFS